MSDFSTTCNTDDDFTLKLYLGKAEATLYQLTRLCDVGTLIDDLISEWDDGVPACVQSQTIFSLFLEDLALRVEDLHVIIKACNKELYPAQPVKTEN